LMTAVAAPLDMAAERCRAAALDRGHGVPLRIPVIVISHSG